MLIAGRGDNRFQDIGMGNINLHCMNSELFENEVRNGQHMEVLENVLKKGL